MRKITFGSSYAKLANASTIRNQFRIVLSSPNSYLVKTSWEPAKGYPCAISMASKDTLGAVELIVQPAGQMPVSYGLSGLIGDCIHNLRTSLDAAVESVRLAMGSRKKAGKFPFAEHPSALTESKLSTLIDALPTVDWLKYFRTDIRPFRSDNSFLWELNKLDNFVKYDSVVPHVTLISVELREPVKFVGGTISKCIIRSDIDQINCIVRILPRTGEIMKAPKMIDLDCRFPTDFDFFPNETVIQILDRMGEEVDSTIRQFELFCLANGVPEFVDEWPCAN